MNVGQIIKKLEKFDPKTPVFSNLNYFDEIKRVEPVRIAIDGGINAEIKDICVFVSPKD